MPVTHDSIPLMRQLARMAGIDAGLFRRMVLVLDVDDAPRLFAEAFLPEINEELLPAKLLVEERPIIVDTTSMQNQEFRTKTPVGE